MTVFLHDDYTPKMSPEKWEALSEVEQQALRDRWFELIEFDEDQLLAVIQTAPDDSEEHRMAISIIEQRDKVFEASGDIVNTDGAHRRAIILQRVKNS